MTREEMVAKLSEEIVRATPTVYTWDMGLQYDYITPDGVGSCLGSIGEWPIIFLKGIQKDTWQEIRSKAAEGTLTPEDVKDTSLELFADSLKQYHSDDYDNLAEIFSDLATLPEELPEVFYCLYDFRDWNPHPSFYGKREDMLSDFREQYCGDIRGWEDMDDEEIMEWYGRLDDDLSGVAYTTFGIEEEEEE